MTVSTDVEYSKYLDKGEIGIRGQQGVVRHIAPRRHLHIPNIVLNPKTVNKVVNENRYLDEIDYRLVNEIYEVKKKIR